MTRRHDLTVRPRAGGGGLRAPYGPILLLVVASAGAARAEKSAEANECRRTPSLSEGPAPTLGRIAATGRTAFVKDGLARAGCPGAHAKCRERAYLVTGDPVILAGRRGAYVCATYRGAGDCMDRTGWLPVLSVADEPAVPATPEGWLGAWTRVEARIRVRPAGEPGLLAVAGDATWGTGDPDGMRRGGVHTGAIEGTVAPMAEAPSFAMAETGTVPVEKGDAYACKVWLRRLGPWLVVDDNLACGGANVTFRGVYRRQP